MRKLERVFEIEAAGVRLTLVQRPVLSATAGCRCWRCRARWPRSCTTLAAYSVAITTLDSLTRACPSFASHPNRLLELHVPLLLKGKFSPNLASVLGLPPFASVELFYAILIGGFWWLWPKLPPAGRRQTTLVSVAKTQQASQ
jgi:hypothetical protein